MRAVVIHQAYEVKIEERAMRAPEAGEVLLEIAVGGICGSDLHYFNHGGFGSVKLKEPMILGHEVSGRVLQMGPNVKDLEIGDLVAVSPSRPCRACTYCLEGLPNHCENMRFYGSAMPFPHIQGAFREQLVADAAQCVRANGLSAGEAAMAEPLSVVLHATRRAGDMLGKRVLITGSGPIGSLAVGAARCAGAAEIVVTDLSENALSYAAKMGADRMINAADTPDFAAGYAAGKGYFDVLYECSGAPQALAAGLSAMRPRGVVMQLGLGGDMAVPMMLITAKELDLRGSFRFHEEFAMAVDLMESGTLDVKPLISHTLPFVEAERGLKLANDRTQTMKAQLSFV